MLKHERFYQYNMSQSHMVAQDCSKVELLANQLRECSETLSDIAINTKVVGSLPPKYRTLRQTWMSLDPLKQNMMNKNVLGRGVSNSNFGS